MSIKYPKLLTMPGCVNAHLFYPCNEKGMVLVEILKERRQKCVLIPPFLNKPSLELLSTLQSKGPVLRKPKGRHYIYYGRAGLCITDLLIFKKPRYKWLEGEIPEKPKCSQVLGNYAKEIVVVLNKEEVCRYVVIARTMASDDEALNRQFLKHKESVTIGLVSGDRKYLPTGYNVVNLKLGWVCEGFYLTEKGLYIEPVVQYLKPIKVDSRFGETRFKVAGKSTIQTIESSDFPNLRLVGYRSVNGLQTKVTGERVFI